MGLASGRTGIEETTYKYINYTSRLQLEELLIPNDSLKELECYSLMCVLRDTRGYNLQSVDVKMVTSKV